MEMIRVGGEACREGGHIGAAPTSPLSLTGIELIDLLTFKCSNVLTFERRGLTLYGLCDTIYWAFLLCRIRPFTL